MQSFRDHGLRRYDQVKISSGDLPGAPVAKTVLPVQGAQVPSLVRELGSQGLQLKILSATTKTQGSQINTQVNKYF